MSVPGISQNWWLLLVMIIVLDLAVLIAFPFASLYL